MGRHLRPLARLSRRPRSAVAAGNPRPPAPVKSVHRVRALKSQELLDLAQAARDVSVDPAGSSLLSPRNPVTIPLLPGAVAPAPDQPATPKGDHSAIDPPHRMPHRVREQVRQWLPDRPEVHGSPPPGADGTRGAPGSPTVYMQARMHVSPRRVRRPLAEVGAIQGARRRVLRAGRARRAGSAGTLGWAARPGGAGSLGIPCGAWPLVGFWTPAGGADNGAVGVGRLSGLVLEPVVL